MTLGDIIKEYRQSHGLSMDKFSEKSGISKSYISLLEKNKHPKTGKPIAPSIQRIKQAAEAMGMDFNVLFSQLDGNVSLKEGIEDIPDRIPMSEFHTIPLFADVAGGLPLLMDDRIVGEVAVTGIPDNGEYFALTVRGQSMEPKIMDGDIVVVHQQQDVDNGDIAIITIDGESATCKRLYTYADHISLLSINPACEPMEFSREQIEDLPVHVYGKVVQLVRRF